jgi:hypothetical protein
MGVQGEAPDLLHISTFIIWALMIGLGVYIVIRDNDGEDF